MSGTQQANLAAVIAERRARDEEALSLFRAMPSQVGFIESLASERLVRGGNRSGKSTIAAVEIASAACRRPVNGPDGKPLRMKYPTNRPLTIWIIGLGETHIGDTLYRLLFLPGAFYCIKDEETGKLRAWNPSDPKDMAREADKVQAPPLIPPRLVPEGAFAWKNKAARIFTSVTLANGTIIHAYSSNADVKVGDPVDLIWVDEDIVYPAYVAEWQARLSDRKGRLVWSSWPRTANPALMSMTKRAKEQRTREKPDVAEWILKFSDNPHIDADEKRKRLEGWSPEERQARDNGEYVLDGVLMYPSFSEDVHCTPKANAFEQDEVDRLLIERAWQPPRDWTRYLFLDPGHSCTAVLFVAVPPPELGDYVVFYDELYLKGYDADGCAERVLQKIAGYRFYKFTIDFRMGRQHGPGIGKTYRDIYAEAFARKGLNSVVTGSSFAFSSDDVPAGILAFRSWLTVRPSGRPRLRVVKPNCRNWIDEVTTYRKHIEKTEATELPASGQADHLMDTSRYAAMDGCRYVAVADDGTGGMDPGEAFRRYQSMWKPGDTAQPPVCSSFGPGRAA
jgi:hypothetical protein